MPDKNNIPTWSEAYAATPPNELEKYLEQQKQPGFIPPGFEGWVAGFVMRLPATDLRRQLLVRRSINHEEVTEEDRKFIFGGTPA